MFNFLDRWNLFLGEIDFTDGGENYVLKVGYVDDEPKEIYVRLWTRSGRFLGGNWLFSIEIDGTQFTSEKLPKSVYTICICQAKRLEKLKVFA